METVNFIESKRNKCQFYFFVKIAKFIHLIIYALNAKKKQYQNIHLDFHLKTTMVNTEEN